MKCNDDACIMPRQCIAVGHCAFKFSGVRRTCRNCGNNLTTMEAFFCSQDCFYRWEQGCDPGAGKVKEAPGTKAPEAKQDSPQLPIGPLSETLSASLDNIGNLVGALTGEALAVGEHNSTAYPKVEKALIKGVLASVRLATLRDAFRDYSDGKMSPGELINKISSQVRHV